MMNATVASAEGLRPDGRYFYVWMAGAFGLVAFGGFIPTFWAKVAAGTFRAPPVVYIHGTILFAWTCFYFIQTSLVAARRTMDHRAWGLAGIALFSVIMCTILLTGKAVLKRDAALGMGAAARLFVALTLLA